MLLIASLTACGSGEAVPRDLGFSGSAAQRLSPAGNGRWLVLLETLQSQFLVTAPKRSAALIGAKGVDRTFLAPDGWLLIDAVAHPSGDVTLLTLQTDPAAAYPLRAKISRFRSGAVMAEHELTRLPPPAGMEDPPQFMSSLDRARIVAYGEDVFAVVRWANNAVQAYRLAADHAALRQEWATWVEPPADLLALGIIGGGFDNFHQGDSAFFVYADVDDRGNLSVGVASTGEVLASHDAFFGESLTAQADPAHFDFGTAVVTRLDASGSRHPSRLLGIPGRPRRLLNLVTAGDSVILVGRIRTGVLPGSWDGWLLASRAATGEVRFERTFDFQGGDMFWAAARLGDGRLVAVGSTNYTQNPAGLSVSDARDGLAVVLDPLGRTLKRIPLPAGPPNRGNEAIAVGVDGRGAVAIGGVENAPGTHAEVFSDAFVVIQAIDGL